MKTDQRALRFGAFAPVVALALPLSAAVMAAQAPEPLPKEDGYRGIWYSNQATKDEYRFKYSGGMATYPQQHVPIAIYAPKVRKTFFVYGGTSREKRNLLHLVSYFDHATGTVPRPTILLDKQTDDAHDNPTLQIDDQGYLWVFSSSHGTARPSYIHRSLKPYSIDGFELVQKTNFSYTQPWWVPEQGFLFLHTRYGSGTAGTTGVRGLHWMTSPDGREWSKPELLANIGQGDYQVSWRHGKRVATAFDYHPAPLGLNARTNIYYVETADGGKTWTNVRGEAVALPLTTPANGALVRDYASEKRLVYLKDVNFDAAGKPVILYLTSKGFAPGPASGPYEWWTARWTGSGWDYRAFTISDHNYDHGSLAIEPGTTPNDGKPATPERWRVIAPTEPGPQPFGTGGEMVLWASRDQGRSWQREKQLTRGSARNHTYARRPVNAHPDFYALWADGNAREPSPSALYFTNRSGDQVLRLPERMEGLTARPEVVALPPK